MESLIHFRAYEELNDYLSPDVKKHRFPVELDDIDTVRQLLSHLGIPEHEVELVLINGKSASFLDRLTPGDSVSAYPVFESFDVAELLRVRLEPLRRTRFIIDRGLAPLAADLRRLGFDVFEAETFSSAEIVTLAEQQKRILVTADPGFLENSRLSRVCVVRESEPRRQLFEIMARLDMLR